MLTEVAIFVPSVARFRVDYLMERVRRAEIAALTVLAAPDRMVSPTLEAALLDRAEVLNIVVGRDGVRELVLTSPDLAPVVETFDLRHPTFAELIRDALLRLVKPDHGVHPGPGRGAARYRRGAGGDAGGGAAARGDRSTTGCASCSSAW